MAHFRTDTNNLRAESKVTHEVMMLSERITPSGTVSDAFGRLRISQPFTLFDSSHRYRLNNKWNTFTAGTATIVHSFHESVMKMNVGTDQGDKAFMETKRVFSYQPGKSLLTMNSFLFNQAKTGLRQRVGYFSANNGIFLEQSNNDLYIVLRSYSSGSLVETRVSKDDWNVDKFDGTGYSSSVTSTPGGHGSGLDITKTHIFCSDIEWLGVGDVRTGFITDGKFIIAHIFHNDNLNDKTYMSTASLPLRYEIENIANTASPSTMQNICSTVISEGGYELGGKARSVGLAVNQPRDLTANGVFYPVVSIRLKPGNLDAIVVPTGIGVTGVSSGIYRYAIKTDATINGAIWSSVPQDGGNTAVQYNTNNSSTMTGGIILEQGYFSTSAQATGSVNLSPDLFRYQLERNSFTGTPAVLTLAVEGQKNGDDVLAVLNWQEM